MTKRISAINKITGFSLLMISLILLISSCGGIQRTASEDILVDAKWIKENKDSVTILETGRTQEDFLAGHIDGAILVDRTVVWDTVDGLAGMLPDPDSVAAVFADLGVSNDKPVVLYDGGNSLWAARVFWALEYLGHSKVHLLNGGLAAWVDSGEALSTDIATPQSGDFKANVQSDLLVDKEYVLGNLNSESVKIIDTRSLAEYTGEDVRADKGGHIPSSINIEWTQNLQDNGSFKSAEELQSLYGNDLSDGGSEAITLCQTGVRGAHTYVALRVAGYDKVKLYDGSWAEWGNDENTPVDK